MTEKSLEFAREIYFDNRKSRLFITDARKRQGNRKLIQKVKFE
jgi:hypothetical protein